MYFAEFDQIPVADFTGINPVSIQENSIAR
jgi:hypothetical protein